MKRIGLSTLLLLTAPAAAKECRALVNLDQVRANGVTARILDVTVGAAPEATVHRHEHAVGAGKAITLLRSRLTFAVETKAGRSTERTWNTVMQRAPGAAPTVLFDDAPAIDLPGPDDHQATFDGQHLLSLVGVFGAHASFLVSRSGYVGGAHGYDEPDYLTFAGGKKVDVAGLVGPSGLADAAQAVAASKFEDDTSKPEPSAKNLADAGLTLRKTGGIDLRALLSCCSWAENHNIFDLRAQLSSPPAALKASIPDKDGWFTGPCGKIKIAKQRLTVSAGGKEQTLDLNAGGRLLGVAWVDLDAPRLGDARADEPGHAQALARGRALAKAGKFLEALPFLDAARSLRPDHPATLSEAGWARFKLGKLDGAEIDLQRAAALVTDKSKRGAILYNLGRVAEQRGDRTLARAHFRASLAARPGNAAVQARLRDLE